MKKFVVLFIGIVSLAVVAIGCNKDAEPAAPQSVTPPAGKPGATQAVGISPPPVANLKAESGIGSKAPAGN